jgi:hypothetical protein
MDTHTGAARYLIDIFGPRTKGPVFVTSLANDKEQSGKYPPRQIITRDRKEIAAFVEKWDKPGRALYYCVSAMKRGINRRAKTNVAELTGLHVDIDFKNTTSSPEDVRTALEQLPLLPHRVNHSGHGLHAYWLFREAIAATPENIERVEAALRRLADLLAGDPSVCEVARLMRVPGSHNSKNNDWLEVINVVSRKGGYTLAQLEKWLTSTTSGLARVNGEPVARAANPFVTFGNAQIIQPPLDVDACLAAMTFRGAGDTSIHRTQLRVAAALINRGVAIDAVVAQLIDVTRRAAGSAGKKWNWRTEETKLRKLCKSWLDKHPEVIAELETEQNDTPGETADEESDGAARAPDAKRQSAATNLAAAKMAEQGNAGVTLADFHAYMILHKYFFAPARTLWPGESVDAVITPIPLVDRHGKPLFDKKGNQKMIRPTTWLDKNKPVQQTTWAPGFPLIIRNRLVAEGGWIKRNGVSVFNLYRPPPDMSGGSPAKAAPWLEHAYKVFNKDDADHVIFWLAHRLQRPEEKINHALVLGSEDHGIGKDTLLEPVKRGIGHWNFQEVQAQQVLGRFNGFLKNAILRINEARDLGTADRFKFYDHLKAYTAAPPDTLRIDEKHMGEYAVFNCVGIIITTNHKTDGIFLPAEDRRHHVSWSDRRKSDFGDEYWEELWGFYDSGGDRHVVAYLKQLDLSRFKPKAPPPQTDAFWAVVNASRAPEEAEFADVLDQLGNPDAITLEMIRGKAVGEFETWLSDRRHRRSMPYRLQGCGYVPVRNTSREDGLWVVNQSRQVIYAKKELAPTARIEAAKALAAGNSGSECAAVKQ